MSGLEEAFSKELPLEDPFTDLDLYYIFTWIKTLILDITFIWSSGLLVKFCVCKIASSSSLSTRYNRTEHKGRNKCLERLCD